MIHTLLGKKCNILIKNVSVTNYLIIFELITVIISYETMNYTFSKIATLIAELGVAMSRSAVVQ